MSGLVTSSSSSSGRDLVCALLYKMRLSLETFHGRGVPGLLLGQRLRQITSQFPQARSSHTDQVASKFSSPRVSVRKLSFWVGAIETVCCDLWRGAARWRNGTSKGRNSKRGY